MTMASKMRSLLQRFRDDESANPTVEFVILVPTVMWIVFSVLEAGWLMTQQTMLNRGVNLAVRDLRIDRFPNPTADTVKERICEYSVILRDCVNALHLELVPSDDPISTASATCVDRTGNIEPMVNFVPGSRVVIEVMVLRACFVMDPLIPGAGLGTQLVLDPSGAYQMVSYAAFVNEPL